VSEVHRAKTTPPESEMCEQRVEKDLHDQIEGLRREINELRLATPRGLQYNEHIADLGEVVFGHACKLGYEGIVLPQLAQVQEPERAGREAGGRRGLEPMTGGRFSRRSSLPK
jgi:hypothetical protein